jgi:tRNA-dihydrouridine synthase
MVVAGGVVMGCVAGAVVSKGSTSMLLRQPAKLRQTIAAKRNTAIFLMENLLK